MKRALLAGLANGTVSITEAVQQHQAETAPLDLNESNELFQEVSPFAAMIMMSENAHEAYVDGINEAVTEAQDYLLGQGLMSESFILPTNPKHNIMRLNKASGIERLTRVLIIANARKANSPHYKRYKIGMAMKKTSMGQMDKQFRGKSARQAIKLWNNLQKHSKLQPQQAKK